MAENKRFVRNYLINRPLQMRMSSYFISISLALVGAGVVYLNYNMSIVRAQIASMRGLPFPFQMAVESRMDQMLYFSIGFLVLTILLNLIYGIYISHRVAGPMYAITEYIKNLRAGKFDERRNLRPTDELAPIMTALHDLADDLRRQASQK